MDFSVHNTLSMKTDGKKNSVIPYVQVYMMETRFAFFREYSAYLARWNHLLLCM